MSCSCCCGSAQPANIQDQHVIDAFKGAVTDANTKNGTSLEFVKIISATQKVVAGYEFEGVIETNEGNYKVKMWVKPGTQGTEYQLFEKA
jgi:hypothetical protein